MLRGGECPHWMHITYVLLTWESCSCWLFVLVLMAVWLCPNSRLLAYPFPCRFRFTEIRYYRPEEVRKGRTVPAHVENVVIFLPDVWTCRPTSLEWQTTAAEYKTLLDSKLSTEEFKTKAESTFFVMPLFFRIVCYCFVCVICCLVFVLCLVVFVEQGCLFSVVLVSCPIVVSFLLLRCSGCTVFVVVNWLLFVVMAVVLVHFSQCSSCCCTVRLL